MSEQEFIQCSNCPNIWGSTNEKEINDMQRLCAVCEYKIKGTNFKYYLVDEDKLLIVSTDTQCSTVECKEMGCSFPDCAKEYFKLNTQEEFKNKIKEICEVNGYVRFTTIYA
jgi:hypothetical protein